MARLIPIRWLALPLGVLCLAAGAYGAGAGSRTKSASVDSFSAGGVTAGCPIARGLALGGFKTNTSADVGLVVSRDEPASRRAWAAAATNTFVNSGQVSASAYCGARRSLRKAIATATIPAQSGNSYPSATAIARCPHGSTVRLGGFNADVSPQPDGPGLNVHAMSLASPRKWKVSATNEGPAAGKLQATAWCGHGPRLSKAARSGKLADGGSATATARCPHGKRVALGGFETAPGGGLGPYLSELSRPAAAKWRAGAVQLAGNGTGSVRAIAYCGE
jgi:hypothetical protein